MHVAVGEMGVKVAAGVREVPPPVGPLQLPQRHDASDHEGPARVPIDPHRHDIGVAVPNADREMVVDLNRCVHDDLRTGRHRCGS